MLVAQYEPMIQTLVADGAYPTFCDRVSLGSFYRSTDLTDMQRSDSSIKRSAKATVTIVNQVAGWLSRNPTGFNHLLCQPLRCGMCSDPRMHQFTSTVVDEEEYIHRSKPNSLNREEITRPDLVSVRLRNCRQPGEAVPLYGRRMYLATVRAQTLKPRRVGRKNSIGTMTSPIMRCYSPY